MDVFLLPADKVRASMKWRVLLNRLVASEAAWNPGGPGVYGKREDRATPDCRSARRLDRSVILEEGKTAGTTPLQRSC
jgi:hypothetical protein